MKAEEIEQLMQEYDFQQEELMKAQLEMKDFKRKVAQKLVENEMVEFLIVDWNKLRRIKRQR